MSEENDSQPPKGTKSLKDKTDYCQEWRERNTEKVREYRRWYENTEHRKAYRREWRQKNPERVREYVRRALQRRDPKKHREHTKRWHAKNRDAVAARALKNKYGLTRDAWMALFEGQGRICKICRSPSPGGNIKSSWATDHCHETGHVRGILCQKCNLALGLLADDPAICEAAAEYLRSAVARL